MNIMWISCVASLIVVNILLLRRVGSRQALGIVTLLTFLIPVWIKQEIFGQALDVRIAVCVVGLVLWLIDRQSSIKTKLIPLDFAVIGLILVHLFSDWTHDGLSLGPIFRAYGEWFLPYVAGRVAIQNSDDIRRLTPVAVGVLCVLSVAGIIEAYSRINPFELLAGARPVDGFPRDHSRWGVKRCYGPTMHPIYFGALMLLLLPFSIYGASRTIRFQAPRWWVVVPAIALLSICLTGSRASILALCVMAYLIALISWKSARHFLLTAGGLGLVMMLVAGPAILKMMHEWGGENYEQTQTIIIEGEERAQTGTLNRFNLLEVYGPAMQRAGMLGFGTTATTGFPVNVPVGPQHVDTLKRVKYIDNTYVLMILRFGYVGLTILLALGLLTVVTQCSLALRPDGRAKFFHACNTGVLIAFLLLILTVWMPHDFGFVFLWTAGASAGRYTFLKPRLHHRIKHVSSGHPRRAA